MPIRPKKEFIDWCQAIEQTISHTLELSEFFTRTQRISPDIPHNKIPTLFIEELGNHINSETMPKSINISGKIDLGGKSISGINTTYENYLNYLYFSNKVVLENTVFTNLYIKHLRIDPREYKNVCFVSCRIAKLEILSTNSTGHCQLSFFNTQIGHFIAPSNAIDTIHITGGCIIDIASPSPESNTPFNGDVQFKNVFFPYNTNKYFLRGPQGYRNLKHHLSGLENSQMASLMHKYEIMTERETDTTTNKIISYIYQGISDFGSSAVRPFLFLFILAGITFIWAFVTDGVLLTHNQDFYTGWRSVLLAKESGYSYYRALMLSGQAISNPIGVFSIKSLVIPNSGWLALWVGAQGILSAISITLSILAIRKRFKLQ